MSRLDAGFSLISTNCDFVLKWISQTIFIDQDFSSNPKSWQLFKEALVKTTILPEKLSIRFRPQITIINAYKSTSHNDCIECLEFLNKKFPNSWRPKFSDIAETLSEAIKIDIKTKDLSFILSLLMNHYELTAASNQVYKCTFDHLFVPLLNISNKLNEKDVFTFLASALCVPFFVRKAVNQSPQSSVGNVVESFTNALVSSESSIKFIPYFIRQFYQVTKILSFQDSISFPIQLVFYSKSLEYAVPILQTIKSLKVYQITQESEEFEMLKKLTDMAMQHMNQNVLVELCRIDFRLVSPFLGTLLSTASQELACAILKKSFKLRNVLSIFTSQAFPSHIVEYPKFISLFCSGVKNLNSTQILGLLDFLVPLSNIAESVLLFWTVYNCRLTNDHDTILSSLIENCSQNPWRFCAAVKSAFVLRLQMPSPCELLSDGNVHPVIFHCNIIERYFEISSLKKVPYNSLVRTIPTPLMSSIDEYRAFFIIENLPSIVKSLNNELLFELLVMVLDYSTKAKSLGEPHTIADICLRLFFNSFFYESHEIINAFPDAALSLLPPPHFDSSYPITDKQFTIALIISGFPQEFLSGKVAISAFNTLYSSMISNQSFSVEHVFDNASKNLSSSLTNLSKSLPKNFVRKHISSIMDSCPSEISQGILVNMFAKINDIGTISISTKPQLFALCKYCYENKISYPFANVMFSDCIDCICEQAKAGNSLAIKELIQIKFTKENSHKIIEVLSMIPDITNKLNKSLLNRLIDLFTQGKCEKYAYISSFASILPIECLLLFLSKSPVEIILTILKEATIPNEEIVKICPYIGQILESKPSLSTIRDLVTQRVTRQLPIDLIEMIINTITELSLTMESLSDISILCSCVTQLFMNSKVVTQIPIISVEICRRMSSLFYKQCLKEVPTLKHLKSISKLYSTVSRYLRPDFIHYLIASFISHISSVSLDDLKLRMAQSSSFPLFSRCDPDDLKEVTVSLHESHRQVFQLIYDRWKKEFQYKGKV